MTIASIAVPKWISYWATDPSGGTVYDNIGLHQRCTSSADACSPFPDEARCEGDGRPFCNMWRTAGFLMNFVTILELAAVAGFVVIAGAGKVKRQDGWKVLGAMCVAAAVVQALGMAVVVSINSGDKAIFLEGGAWN